MSLTSILQQLLAGHGLDRATSTEALDQVLTEDVAPAQVAAFLTLIQARGARAEELAGFADSLGAAAVGFPGRPVDGVDTCGTGGDGSQTFNISTTAALVAASAGANVYKHGNRAATSQSGSADLLEELGLPIDQSPQAAADAVKQHGFAFLFARAYHPILGRVAPVRSTLGFPTVFNLLGPLLNPAGVRRQVVGVYSPEVQPLLAEALRLRGTQHAMVLHGAEGLDEATPCGPFRALVVRGEAPVQEEERDPSELGLARCSLSELQVGNAAESRAKVEEVLAGDPGPARDTVLLNAALALEVAGAAADWREGFEQARSALDDGRARSLVDTLRSGASA